MAKFETFFRCIGKYQRHRMGTETKYVPVQGANGPEFRQVSQRKFEVKSTPTRVTDENVSDRLREEKFFNRTFIECDRDGSPAGASKKKPVPAEAEPVPGNPAEVTDSNSAVQYLAAHVEGFDPDVVMDKGGKLNYNMIKKFAEQHDITFPNYGS